MAPEQTNDGIVDLVVRITRDNAILSGRTKYRYSKLQLTLVWSNKLFASFFVSE